MVRLILLGLMVISCKTTDPSQPRTPEDASVKFRPDDEGSIPPSLWSPNQRRMRAGFYYLVGEYLSLRGAVKDAKPFIDSSYQLDPNPFLGAKSISAGAAVGEFNQALPKARRMVLLYPKAPSLRFLYATLLMRTSKHEEAIAEFEKAIDLDPKMERAYLQLAQLHQARGDANLAIVIVKDLVSHVPASSEGWSTLAKLYLAGSQKEKALDPAEKAHQMNPSNPVYALIYAVVLESLGKSKEAIALYEKLYWENPANEEIIARMVKLYREVGGLESAMTLLDELAKSTDRVSPGIELQRAFVLWELRRFREAAQVLAQLSELFPNSERLLYLSGLGKEKVEQPQQALETYRKIPNDSPYFYSAKLREAVVLHQLKDVDQALSVVREVEAQKGLEIKPELYELGSSMMSEKTEYQSAISFLQKGRVRFPEAWRLLFLIGVYQEKSGDVEACIATMKQVIEKDPTNSSAFNYLGYLYAERNQNLDEAEKLIVRALELRPKDGFYLDSLGWVYFQRGDYQKALATLQKALEIVPNEGVVLEHLADTYDKLGDPGKALEHYERAIKARLDDRDRVRVEKKLEAFRAKKAIES